MNASAVADIPRAYTVLAEIAACATYVVIARGPRLTWRRASLFAGALALLAGVHAAADALPLAFWIPGMIGAVAIMLALIWLDTGSGPAQALNLTGRAFVLAELMASAVWQLVLFFAGPTPSPAPAIVASVILGYAAMCATVWAAHRRGWSAGENPRLARRESLITVAIGLVTFTVSNLSFVSIATPLSASTGFESAYVRTLVDLSGFLVLYVSHLQMQDYERASELAGIEATISAQQRVYRESQRNIESLSRTAHDLKHQIAAVRAESDRGARGHLLDTLEDAVAEMSSMLSTGNPVLDVLVNQKMRICRENHIEFTVMADGAALAHFDPMSVASLVGNSLDNAIEATRRLPRDERWVTLDVRRRHSMVCLTVMNSFAGSLRRDNDGNLVTTKSDSSAHGIGLRSIRYTAERLGGHTAWSSSGATFTLRALLPLSPAPPSS